MAALVGCQAAPPPPHPLLLRLTAPPPAALQIHPAYGWALTYEWSALLFVLGFAACLRGVYLWGRRDARTAGARHLPPGGPSPAQRPWGLSFWALAGVVGLLEALPWWAGLVG